MGRSGTTRMPLVPVAWGELMDKISILEIKTERISEPTRVENAHAELALLRRVRDAHLPSSAEVNAIYSQLKGINECIWDLEVRVRQYEREQNFGQHFIEAARAVYQTNDQRSRIKQQMDRLLDSELKEEKYYQR